MHNNIFVRQKHFLILSIFFLSFLSWLLFKLINYNISSKDLNVILISIDTLRADHMSIFGYDKNTTPNIDSWAKSAFVFNNYITASPQTFPSFVSLMTGLDPLSTGIYSNYNADGSPKYEHISSTTLAQLLKNRKYSTAAFLTNVLLATTSSNMNKYFDEYNFSYDRKTPENFTSRISSWLNKNGNNKYFLWIHLSDPHSPYMPPDEFKCKFSNNGCENINKLSLEKWEETRLKYESCQSDMAPEKIIEDLSALYDGGIGYTDKMVGQILAAIKDSGQDKKTIVIFLADHGEGFDHNYYFTHADKVYHSSIHVPLIIKHPMINSSGQTIKRIIQNTDVLPTILDLLNLPYNDLGLDGISFADLFYDRLIFPLSSILNTNKRNYSYSVNVSLNKSAIFDGKYKYIFSSKNAKDACIYNNQSDELFDIKEDKNENNNLYNDKTAIASKLKNKLFSLLNRHNIIDGRINNPVSEEKQRQLKSFGY